MLLLVSPSVVSDSLQPHGVQHTRLSCPSPSPGVWSNSCPLSQWCHLTISSSVVPFSSCLQSLPASGSLPMSLLFASGGQSIGALASASVLPMSIKIDFLWDWLVWFPYSLRDSPESSIAPQFEDIHSLVLSLFCCPALTSIYDYWKNYSFYYLDLSIVFQVQIHVPYAQWGQTTKTLDFRAEKALLESQARKTWKIPKKVSTKHF